MEIGAISALAWHGVIDIFGDGVPDSENSKRHDIALEGQK